MQQPINESSVEEAQKVREKQCNKKAAGESGFKSICITYLHYHGWCPEEDSNLHDVTR